MVAEHKLLVRRTAKTLRFNLERWPFASKLIRALDVRGVNAYDIITGSVHDDKAY